MKSTGLTRELHLKLFFLSIGEAIGIPSVAVKCVDIRTDPLRAAVNTISIPPGEYDRKVETQRN